MVFSSLGTLKYTKNTTNKGLSVITGSKQQKKAVLRNKLRRQLYTIFRNYYNNPVNTPLVVGMFYVSKHSYGMSFEELNIQFCALLTKAQKNT